MNLFMRFITPPNFDPIQNSDSITNTTQMQLQLQLQLQLMQLQNENTNENTKGGYGSYSPLVVSVMCI